MARLTVKNVGPIREAELEVKKHTVFIGPQGSGKSTLAKLISIGGDRDILPLPNTHKDSLLGKYSLDTYTSIESHFLYETELFQVEYNKQLIFDLTERGNQLCNEALKKANINNGSLAPDETYRGGSLWGYKDQKSWYDRKMAENPPFISGLGNRGSINYNFYNVFLPDSIIKTLCSYIPSERNLTATLSAAIWGLLHSDVSLPRSLTSFGRDYEQSRNNLRALTISFLNTKYVFENGTDRVFFNNTQSINLAQSASGYQSIIPLLLVVEHQRRQSRRRFIIEEPELNLYPTAQKDLIYALMGGLDPNVRYQDAEWVITTHSPYVLSSLNTLMLAYIIAQRSEELRAEVDKLIPARCWINPHDFVAYYVDNGTVRSIVNEQTGLIDDNELDDVSEDLAGEQDQLFELSRSVSRA